MDYKFWKLLKDSGFPQTIPDAHGYWFTKGSNVRALDPDTGKYRTIRSETVYVPTLAELIHECGEEFKILNRYKNGKFGCNDIQEYPTPEMAVARLWLEI